MVISITDFDKARIFAMYWPCSFINGIGGQASLSFTDCSSISLGQIAATLRLTSLHEMPEEQIHELCKVVNEKIYGDYRYSKWEIVYDPKNNLKKQWFACTVKNAKSEYEFNIDLIDGDVTVYDREENEICPSEVNRTYWQWYFQQSIAIPLYPWGKNAIQLGIAKEKE